MCKFLEIKFLYFCFFFFFKQKTAYEMRISDWSSDVCSSDLAYGTPLLASARFEDLKFGIEIMAEEEGGAVEEIAEGNGSDDQPQLAILAQYVKDMSDETPNAPQVFQPTAQPQLGVNDNVGVRYRVA